MEIIELQPPRPREKVKASKVYDFKITGMVPIPKAGRRRFRRLDQVLTARQSRRDFKAPLTFEELGAILWHSAHVRERRMLDGGNVWQSRPAPSGGGCHPIQIIVLKAPMLKNAVLLYDAEHHAFGVRDVPNRGLLKRCVSEVELCLETRRGTVLWFVADLGKSGARYFNPESLAWRDSGALLATIALVAEGMGLDCCGLGLHDIPSLRRFLKLDDCLIGVGGCVLGGRRKGASRGGAGPRF